MMQKTYNTLAALTTAGTTASAGAATHGVSLALTVGAKAAIDADLNGLTVATTGHLTGRVELRTLRDAQQVKIDVAYGLASTARDLLGRSLGRKYSPAWEGTGFNYSLRIPRSVPGLEYLTRSLSNFLTEHPEHEVENVVTAISVGAALDAMTAAQTAVTVKKAAVRTMLEARRQKEKKMRLRLRGLVEELNRVLGPLDARWEAFGLNQPGIKQAPDRPDKVSVTLFGAAAVVKWKKSDRAEYYRLWMKVIGVDDEAVPVASPADLDHMTETLPAAQIEFSLSAVNNGGESARSEVVIVTIA